MSRTRALPVSVVALASTAAFLAGDLYAATLSAMPGRATTNLEAAVSQVPSYLAANGPVPSLDPMPLAVGALACCGVWAAWSHQLVRAGNYRQGEEHGSARWATPHEASRFADPTDPYANIILTSHVSLALARADHDPRYERNRNVLVVGGSGSGKTRSYVLPNLLQANASYLVTDPKGTLAGEVGPVLVPLGYEVRRVDTVDFRRSDHYNPIAYVRTQQDVLELVDCLIANTTRTRSDSADPFWENSERLLYTALVSYLVDHCLREDANLPGLMTLLSLAEASEADEGFESPLDLLFREVETGCRCVVDEGGEEAGGRAFCGGAARVRWVRVAEPLTPDQDFALSRYRAFKAAAGKTLKSIIISCNARLSALDSAELRELLSRDDMGLDRMGEAGRRTAIFATSSDTNGTYSFVLALLVWQATNLLCERALREHGGSLPVPVHLVLDEFANIGRLPDFERTVAVVRSRNIGVSVILQSTAQLRSRYGDDAQTIVDCCDTTLFLGGKSSETNRGVSEQVGKETVSLLGTSESRGANPNSTQSRNVAERDLIQSAEVAKLDRRRAIVLIAGADPVIDGKYDPAGHPRLREGVVPMK